MLDLTADLDRILLTDKHFLMADWITAARQFGNTSDERLWLEWNARAQVTTWGSIESNGNLIADCEFFHFSSGRISAARSAQYPSCCLVSHLPMLL